MSLYDHVGGQYLSAKKLGNRVITGKVVDIAEEQVRGNDGSMDTKHVLYVEGEDKGLVLNTTNIETLIAMAGNDDENEVVRKEIEVELRTEMVSFGSKQVPGIRVYPVSKPLPEASPAEEAVPF